MWSRDQVTTNHSSPADPLPGDDALLQRLRDGGLGVVDVALLLVVLRAHVLRGGGVLGHVAQVALLVHLGMITA